MKAELRVKRHFITIGLFKMGINIIIVYSEPIVNSALTAASLLPDCKQQKMKTQFIAIIKCEHIYKHCLTNGPFQ
jgi:hypothetical protein